MTWLRRLLGGGERPSSEMTKVFEKMRRLLDDDDAQIEMLGEPIRGRIRSGANCDEIPGATGRFGYDSSNPIPVNDPIGELSYLSKLRTLKGQRLLFHRIGSADTRDIFEAVDFSGNEWFVLYLDMYHSRKSRHAPAGLNFSSEPSQFSGFTSKLRNFPDDFAEEKAKGAGGGLNMLYAPLSTVNQALSNANFKPPSDHVARLREVSINLSHTL